MVPPKSVRAGYRGGGWLAEPNCRDTLHPRPPLAPTCPACWAQREHVPWGDLRRLLLLVGVFHGCLVIRQKLQKEASHSGSSDSSKDFSA